ncbi:MAG: corrinoid protein [Anaerolineales bacterium]
MNHIQAAYEAILKGDRDALMASVESGLNEGLASEEILNQGLIAAMTDVGDRFERGELYVPEMLVAARAMQSGLKLLKPHLIESGVKSAARVVIGTVQGDLHDIGKNLVAMMLEGAGFEVTDLGNDIKPEMFADAAREHKADIIGVSALLTTTMSNMQAVVEALEDIGLREKVKVMVGGAPVTQEFADQIGADGFAPDASAATRLAKAMLES